MEGQELSFSEEADKRCALFLVFLDGIFYPHVTTKVSGIENYPSASMFCYIDDLAHLLPCLDL